MPDRKKVIKKAERIMCSTVDRDMIDSFCEDVIALLKEQEEQKRKWLQNIADNQLAFAPSERDNAYCYIKHQGIYDGLQMAYDILTEGR